MRIIAGEHRGRLIDAPTGLATRPMMDRVREAVFSSLGEAVVDVDVLDLFAGSGSLGLEALSRGARSARMVERHRATARLLRRNVETLGLHERAEVVVGDALQPSSWTSAPGEALTEGALTGETRYGLVFLDPPFPLLDEGGGRSGLLRALERLREFLEHDATIVLHVKRHALREEEVPGWRTDRRVYGRNEIWYLTSETGESAP